MAVTIRYPDTFEQHRWETAVMDVGRHFFRSPAVKPIVLLDRLGGGDTWNGGFYYGLLTAGFNPDRDGERSAGWGCRNSDEADHDV